MSKLGLLKEQIRLRKKDEELIGRIIEAREIPEEEHEIIKEMLTYNMWTTRQFSDITGLNESTIANKCRPMYRDGDLKTELDFCFPFPNLKTDGGKYIIRNEKSEALLP